MNIQKAIIQSVEHALEKLGVSGVQVLLEHPADLSHGDFSTNVALVVAKKLDKNPKDFALELIQELTLELIPEVEKVEQAGPGFINFFLTKEFLAQSISESGEGTNTRLKGKKILIEHTSPNAFKPLHIGHFMANTVGESIARLLEFSGAQVERAAYGSDIGLPTAKAVWGMMQLTAEEPEESASLARKMEFIGNAYTHASELYEKDPEIKTQIDEINIHLYKQDDQDLLAIYQKGRGWSIAYLKDMYERLDTHFDYLFYESEVFEEGSRIVKENLQNIFEESEGAIVFKGEDHGLHTRVFISSKGAPTYEAKELGLYVKKASIPFDTSIVVTGNEQAGMLQVTLKAFEQIDATTAKKLNYIHHGLMLGTDGKKLSSRKGGALSAEELLNMVKDRMLEKVEESSVDIQNKESVAEAVALAALKYQILKQGSGKNIIFDIEQALSFEGDSGPYLQYTIARINSLLEKGKENGFEPGVPKYNESAEEIFQKLYRFGEVVERAGVEFAPQFVVTFLIEIAGAFNSFYGKEQIVDADDPEKSEQNLAVAKAVGQVLQQGLRVLAIPVIEKM